MLTQVLANIEIAYLIWCSKEVDIYSAVYVVAIKLDYYSNDMSFSEIHYKLFTIIFL
jgi:hypothetical protein